MPKSVLRQHKYHRVIRITDECQSPALGFLVEVIHWNVGE
ncbi:hypothetical protein TPY_3720 [Sulfobacillus acidophilus TPY]|nr:hypothetical protein TPY_3720 [Sulfobacillus acidophilus TPY]